MFHIFLLNGSIFDRIKKSRAFWLCFICALASFLDQFLVRVFTFSELRDTIITLTKRGNTKERIVLNKAEETQ